MKTKRLKTVFSSNPQLAHIWAQQNHPYGKTKSMFFEDTTIYSFGYHYVIAQFYKGVNGKPVVLVNSKGYSNTTARHTLDVRRAISHITSFEVPEVKSPKDQENIEHLESHIVHVINRILTARVGMDSILAVLDESIALYNTYMATFGIKKRFELDADFRSELEQIVQEKHLREKQLNSLKEQQEQNEYTYKVGMDEVEGLKSSILKAIEPMVEVLSDSMCFGDQSIEDAEYKRRDGFIPHSHNHGGIQMNVHLPKCQEYDFPWIEFDEYETSCEDGNCGECDVCCDEGHFDAFVKFWFKFEGFTDSGEMQFYINISGGSQDAPYFRTVPTLAETEFTARTLKQVETKGRTAVLNILKTLNIKTKGA